MTSRWNTPATVGHNFCLYKTGWPTEGKQLLPSDYWLAKKKMEVKDNKLT